MIGIEIVNTKVAPSDRFTQTPAGETATIVSNGVVLHPELASMIPRATKLVPLTSFGDEHTYHVTVRGYTVEQFRLIAIAYTNKNFERAEELINEIRPKQEWS